MVSTEHIAAKHMRHAAPSASCQPLVAHLSRTDEVMSLSCVCSGLHGAILSPCVAHLAVAVAALLPPSQANTSARKAASATQSSRRKQQSMVCCTISCELGIISFGDQSATFHCKKRRHPAIGKLVIDRLAIELSQCEAELSVQELLLLDLRSQRAEYAAIMSRRQYAKSPRRPMLALTLKYRPGALCNSLKPAQTHAMCMPLLCCVSRGRFDV